MTQKTTPTRTPAQLHRSEMRRYVWLPMAFYGLIVVLGVLTVLLLPEAGQKGLMADWLATWLLLFPVLLCLLPLCIGLVAAVVLVQRGHVASQAPLAKLNAWMTRAQERVRGASERVGRTTAVWGGRFAFVDRLFSVFDMPDEGDKP